MKEKPTVLGIGELLWDYFPEGRCLGGAQENFACHGLQLGATVYPVSSVGLDEPGFAILNALSARGISTVRVTGDPGRPTGKVLVTVDPAGKSSYVIRDGVAWDAVPMSNVLAGRTDAVCFGTLAQRGLVSRATIRSFLQAMRPGSLEIFDINLRQGFFTKEIIETSLKLANILKLNDEELPVLTEMFGLSGSVRDRLEALLNTFSLKLIAYTRGKDGSLLVTPDGWNDCPGMPVNVVDSAGAGDSFTAALCMGMLNGNALATINHQANRMAAFVCSHSGATPQFPNTLKKPNPCIKTTSCSSGP